MCFAPQRRALFRHRNFQKWSEAGVLCIATSKTTPTLRCFVHFDLEMCFTPQRRALFRHLNFQECSENGVFCTFWLRNVLRTTTACTFSSLIWPAGSAPAALASLLFDPPEPQIIGKHSVSRLSYLFTHLQFLSSYSFSSTLLSFLTFLFSLPLPCSAFHLSLLSEVWLLNFLQLWYDVLCKEGIGGHFNNIFTLYFLNTFKYQISPKRIPNSQKQKQLPNTQWVKYVYCPALLTLEVGRARRNHSTNTLWKIAFPKAFEILWPFVANIPEARAKGFFPKNCCPPHSSLHLPNIHHPHLLCPLHHPHLLYHLLHHLL